MTIYIPRFDASFPRTCLRLYYFLHELQLSNSGYIGTFTDIFHTGLYLETSVITPDNIETMLTPRTHS